MDKREGAILAVDYESKKHTIGGQYMSVKLDGQRVIWDGGISTGLQVTEVPWAFNPKAGLKATGLWSRNFKAVMASDEFVEKLPKGMCLDGEVWLGNGRFEDLESTARTETWATEQQKRDAWAQVQYKCFDVPSYNELFRDGRMYIRKENHFITCLGWVQQRISINDYWKPMTFENALRLIPDEFRHEQIRLPLFESEAIEIMQQKLAEVTDAGGEGLMIRRLSSIWTPKRSSDLLKIKKFFDSEGIVTGYQEGEGRLKGMVGAVLLKGLVPIKIGSGIKVEREFKISGFTDLERENAQTLFPIGSEISYRYNEITDDGFPRFGRYWRKKNPE